MLFVEVSSGDRFDEAYAAYHSPRFVFMALIVQKFGGTSVGDIARIQRIAKRAITQTKAGDQLVIVASAMSGETDRLLSLAQQISEEPDKRELDALLSTGENVSVALIAIAIRALGGQAISLTGAQIEMVTDDAHTKARILKIGDNRIREHLKAGKIVVIAGFQGITSSGEITTLGRGGSDTSAVAIAIALQADLCEIYTDVDGVYTADPRIVPHAKKIERICFEEMLNLASEGAKVLQVRSVELAMKFQMPIHLRSSFSDVEGTLVTTEVSEMEQEIVRAITCDKSEARIIVYGMFDPKLVLSKIFGRISEQNISVDLIVNSFLRGADNKISFTVKRQELKDALRAVESVLEEIGGKVDYDDEVEKVTICGVGMRSHPGVAAKMFNTLEQAGIPIYMVSTSEIIVSAILPQGKADEAVRLLHSAFSPGATL